MKLKKHPIDPSATVYPILFAIAFSHLLNDLLQSIIPALYPIIKDSFQLTYSQIGLITFAFQVTSSFFQPFVGFYTDKNPKPYSFVVGMSSTMIGIVLLALAKNFEMLLIAAVLVGFGSSIFHPESSKLAFYASGGKRGLAQSIFQLGGNSGTAIGPLLVALIVLSFGQISILWFVLIALLAIVVLTFVGNWYNRFLTWRKANPTVQIERKVNLPRKKVIFTIAILLILIFSKFFYNASMSSYFTFYLMDRFSISVKESQFYLFIYLTAVAGGTLIGGPIGDRIGRKYVIWFSIVGAAPFTLLLPHVGFYATITLSIVIGFVLASAFSAILVYAQELLPGRVGMVSGLFFGFGFGMAGLGSALLGNLADSYGIRFVFLVCSFLPLIGMATVFLPTLDQKKIK